MSNVQDGISYLPKYTTKVYSLSHPKKSNDLHIAREWTGAILISFCNLSRVPYFQQLAVQTEVTARIYIIVAHTE